MGTLQVGRGLRNALNGVGVLDLGQGMAGCVTSLGSFLGRVCEPSNTYSCLPSQGLGTFQETPQELRVQHLG